MPLSISQGDFKDTTWPDDWTSVTRDGKLSAQFEHTMVVTETGVEVYLCLSATASLRCAGLVTDCCLASSQVLTARTAKSYPYPWLK
jgi:hypothetical protein